MSEAEKPESDEEWRTRAEVADALDLEGSVVGVTVHRQWVGFKTVPEAFADE